MAKKQIRTNPLVVQINKTRWCRIYAYKRTKSWNFFFQVLLFGYNLAIIVASILFIAFGEKFLTPDKSSIIILGISVCSFGIGLFVNMINFSDQTLEFKHCYIELGKILSSLKQNQISNCEASKSYNDIMAFSRNHSDEDFYRLKVDFFFDDDVCSPEERVQYPICYWKSKLQKYQIRNFIIKTIFSLGIYAAVKLISLFIKFVLDIKLLFEWVVRKIKDKKHEKK